MGGRHRQGPRTGTSAPMGVYLYHIFQHSIGSLVALGLHLGLELEKDGSGCWGLEKDGTMAPDEALALGLVLGKRI